MEKRCHQWLGLWYPCNGTCHCQARHARRSWLPECAHCHPENALAKPIPYSLRNGLQSASSNVGRSGFCHVALRLATSQQPLTLPCAHGRLGNGRCFHEGYQMPGHCWGVSRTRVFCLLLSNKLEIHIAGSHGRAEAHCLTSYIAAFSTWRQ